MTFPPFSLPIEADPADAALRRPRRRLQLVASQSEIERILSILGIEALGYTAQHLLFRDAGGSAVAFKLQTFGSRHLRLLVGGDRALLRRCFPIRSSANRGVDWDSATCCLIEACCKAGMRYADELQQLGFSVRWESRAGGMPGPEPRTCTSNTGDYRRTLAGQFESQRRS